MKSTLAACLLTVAAPALAEVTEVRIPGMSWGISFDMPTLARYQGQASHNGFRYTAVSAGVQGGAGTILSFFLEDDSSGSNQECFRNYWSKSRQNPMVVQSSVKTASLPGYEQVFYKYVPGQPNANFYFVNQGYCIDVHVSLSKAMPDEEETLLAIGRSIRVFTAK